MIQEGIDAPARKASNSKIEERQPQDYAENEYEEQRVVLRLNLPEFNSRCGSDPNLELKLRENIINM